MQVQPSAPTFTSGGTDRIIWFWLVCTVFALQLNTAVLAACPNAYLIDDENGVINLDHLEALPLATPDEKNSLLVL